MEKQSTFTVLDLVKGFHQGSNHPTDGSIEKTAFGTEFGHYEFVGCVMGAKNTPAFFQHKVEIALRKDRLLDVGMLRMSAEGVVEIMNSGGTACVTPYIDDLIVYSDTFEEHQRDVRKVLACLSKNRYFIQPPKCAWCCEYVKFVGGIVGNGLLAMDPEKIQAIDD